MVVDMINRRHKYFYEKPSYETFGAKPENSPFLINIFNRYLEQKIEKEDS